MEYEELPDYDKIDDLPSNAIEYSDKDIEIFQKIFKKASINKSIGERLNKAIYLTFIAILIFNPITRRLTCALPIFSGPIIGFIILSLIFLASVFIILG